MKHLPELDLVRGIAVVCMVLNHSGVLWHPDPAQRDGLLSALVFVGEFAPVLFFFTTGVGHGIRAQKGAANHWDVLYKVGLLLLADWFLMPSSTGYSPDFLAFIGFSMALLHLLSRASDRVLGALLALVLAGRFVAGVLLRSRFEEGHPLLALLGVSGGLPFGSYYPLPWLAYPFAGCLAGRWLARHDLSDTAVRRRLTWALGTFGGLAASVGAGLVVTGHPAYRWGAMSISFFISSVAMVALVGTLSFAVARTAPRVVAFFSASGPASFAAVPIHYGLIHVLLSPISRAATIWAALASLVLTALVLEASRQFAVAAAALLARIAAPRAVILVGLCVAALLAVAALAMGSDVAVYFALAGQLLICGLLVNRLASRPKPVLPPVAAPSSPASP